MSFYETPGVRHKKRLYLSHRLIWISLREVGAYFGGIGPSAMTQNTLRPGGILQQDKRLLAEVQNLKKMLSE